MVATSSRARARATTNTTITATTSTKDITLKTNPNITTTIVITGQDVIFGRGVPQNHTGNMLYRALLGENIPLFEACRKLPDSSLAAQQKCTLVSSIVQAVHHHNGRFLLKVSSTSTSTSKVNFNSDSNSNSNSKGFIYRQLTEEEAFLRTRKALDIITADNGNDNNKNNNKSSDLTPTNKVKHGHHPKMDEDSHSHSYSHRKRSRSSSSKFIQARRKAYHQQKKKRKEASISSISSASQSKPAQSSASIASSSSSSSSSCVSTDPINIDDKVSFSSTTQVPLQTKTKNDVEGSWDVPNLIAVETEEEEEEEAYDDSHNSKRTGICDDETIDWEPLDPQTSISSLDSSTMDAFTSLCDNIAQMWGQ